MINFEEEWSNFDDIKKWQCFNNLLNQSYNLKHYATKKLYKIIEHHFENKNLLPEWEFQPHDKQWQMNLTWNIKGFDPENSFTVRVENSGHCFGLGIANRSGKANVFLNHLRQPKYYPLTAEENFNRIDSLDYERLFFQELGNYSFSGKNDFHISENDIEWYAFYKTEILAEQIIEKVNRYVRNPELTQLFVDLNNEVLDFS